MGLFAFTSTLERPGTKAVLVNQTTDRRVSQPSSFAAAVTSSPRIILPTATALTDRHDRRWAFYYGSR